VRRSALTRLPGSNLRTAPPGTSRQSSSCSMRPGYSTSLRSTATFRVAPDQSLTIVPTRTGFTKAIRKCLFSPATLPVDQRTASRDSSSPRTLRSTSGEAGPRDSPPPHAVQFSTSTSSLEMARRTSAASTEQHSAARMLSTIMVMDSRRITRYSNPEPRSYPSVTLKASPTISGTPRITSPTKTPRPCV
jgi:hypothetical protein